MTQKRLFLFLAVIFILLAPSEGKYYENTALLPVLSIKSTFGTGVETGKGEKGIVWNGNDGITETVDQIMQRQRDTPQHWDGKLKPTKEEEEFEMPEKQNNPDAPQISHWPLSDNNPNGLIERDNPQTVGTTFNGITSSESGGWIPPDNNGAVGPTQVLVTCNNRIRVFSKAGVVGALDASTDVMFASVITSGFGCSDTHVRYDRLSQRWFIVLIDVATPNRVLIAVSSGPTITGTASFTFFQFRHDLVGTTPNPDTGGFADYPTLGIDKNALYIGVNVFNAAGTSFLGCTGFVVRKSALITGSLVVTAFRQLCTGSTAGPYTPQGVDNDDPSSTEGYFIGTDALVYSKLQIRRVSTPGATPTISGNISLTVPATYAPINQPCQGTSTTLDPLDDRLFAAMLKKNTLTGVQTLWTAHNIRVSNAGVGGSGGTRNGSRWYEIANLTTTPTLSQSGTLFDASATVRGFWIPSVCMSGQGHMALITSTASSTNRAEIAASGRLYTDAAGTTQTYTLAQSSTFAYNVTVTTPQRWGDYSQVVVDPTDNMTMWSFEEYCSAANQWCVRCIQLKAPPPATITSASNVTQGLASVNSTIIASVVSGSGYYDPGSDVGGPGFSNHISATVSGGVTVNSVTFTDATHLTLSLNTTASAPGLKNVTITNPDGQVITVNNILTVDAPSPVTMANFGANVYAANNIKLEWTTLIEINNSGFDIERKPKERSDWTKIGNVPGKGNSESPNSYSFEDKKLPTGKFNYRLKQIDFNGNYEYFNLSQDVQIGTPPAFDVTQSYPNPSNPKSRIDYQMPFAGKISIKVFDLEGREVATLVNENKDAGYYSAEFDGSNLASGIYIYRVIANTGGQSYTKTMKMVLVK